MIKRIVYKLSSYVEKFKKLIDFRYQVILRNDVTIISNNCIAGYIYQAIGARYNSPTIGLQFPQEDFVKFCKSFSYYINKSIVEDPSPSLQDFISLGGEKIDFPVGKLDDLSIFFQHYDSFAEAENKWELRRKRMNKEKLFFVFMVYDSTPIEVLREFEALELPNSVVLTNSLRSNNKNIYAIKNGDKQWFHNIGLGKKKYFQKFNYVSWLYKGILRGR